MTNITEAATPDAEEEIQEVVETALPTLADIQKQRDEKLKQLSGEAKEESEEEAEEAEEEVEGQEDEGKAEGTSVLSKEVFDSMSDEDKEEVLTELREATGKAFGNQRKEIRELKAKLEAAEAAQKEVATTVSSNSPFGSIHTEEAADQTIEQIERNIEQYEDQLLYEPVTKYDEKTDKELRGIEVNGQFVDLGSFRQWIKDQKANIKQLGERKKEIRQLSKMFENEDVEIETLKQEFNMSEEESKAFESAISNPSFSVIKTVKPEYAKELFKVFAQASTYGRAPKVRAAPKAKNSTTTLPKGGGANSKSIVSQIEKLTKIVKGETGASLQERQLADRNLRALKRQGK